MEYVGGGELFEYIVKHGKVRIYGCHCLPHCYVTLADLARLNNAAYSSHSVFYMQPFAVAKVVVLVIFCVTRLSSLP